MNLGQEQQRMNQKYYGMGDPQQIANPNEYDSHADDGLVRKSIMSYRRSSYHLGISYYIYHEKKEAYNRQHAQMQQTQQMRHGGMQNEGSQNIPRVSEMNIPPQNQMQALHPLMQKINASQGSMQQAPPPVPQQMPPYNMQNQQMGGKPGMGNQHIGGGMGGQYMPQQHNMSLGQQQYQGNKNNQR